MSEGEASQPSEPRGDGSPEAAAGGQRRRAVTVQALALCALGFAYRELFTAPSAATELTPERQLEDWLFVPTENAPLVVLALAAWLVYRRWPRVRSLGPGRGPGWLVAPSLALGVATYLWATFTSAVHLQAFSLAFSALGLTALYRGLAGVRVLWLPIVFVLFCVPIPPPLFLALVWKLQLVTAEYTGWLLYLLQEPAVVSGDQILRASQGFQVIEGCSGLRSAETLTMLTIILIDLFGRRGAHALTLFFCAPLVAFGLNGLRVLALILNPHSELLGVHTLQGVAILLVGLLIIYGLDGLFERYLAGPPQHRPLPTSGESTSDRLAQPATTRAAIGLPAGILIFVALVTVGISQRGPVWQPPDRGTRILRQQVGAGLDAWESESAATDWMFVGSSSFGEVVHRRYRVLGEEVEVFIGTANLRPRGGSPLSPTNERPGSGWAVLESEEVALEPGGRLVQGKVLKKGGRRLLAYHWSSGALGLARETLRALFALDHSPFRRPAVLYMARISTPLVDRPPDTPARARRRAEERLARVYAQLEPVLAELEAPASGG